MILDLDEKGSPNNLIWIANNKDKVGKMEKENYGVAYEISSNVCQEI